MKTLLEIPKPKSNSFIIWEHVLKSAVAFAGTFALLFFGPIMLGARRKGGDSEDSLSYNAVEFILNHPEVHVGASVLAVVIMNLFILVKNRKIKYITKIGIDEDKVQIELVNLYFTRRNQISIPKSDFDFYIKSSVSDDNEKKQTIIFRNTRESRVVGEIKPSHFFWSEQIIQLRNMIGELKDYRAENRTKRDGAPGITTLTKW